VFCKEARNTLLYKTILPESAIFLDLINVYILFMVTVTFVSKYKVLI